MFNTYFLPGAAGTLHRLTGTATAAAAAAAICWPVAATAQAAGPWRVSASIYAYLPEISGSMAFPVDTGGSSMALTPEMILDNLKFTFMGAIDVHNGRWGVFSDLVYMNLGNTSTVERDLTIAGRPLPVGATAKLDLGIEGSAWTLAGEYRVVSDGATTLDLLAGVRRFDQTNSLRWDITGNVGSISAAHRNGQAEIGVLVWDAIVGAKGRWQFGERGQWSLPYYLDAGIGQSKSTWQAAAGVGYRFGWGELSAMWRTLDYRFEDGSPVKSMNFNGPLIGATFRW